VPPTEVVIFAGADGSAPLIEGLDGLDAKVRDNFFHNDRAVLSHGCTKEDIVPPSEIERAIGHRRLFTQNPVQHQYVE